MDREPNLAMVIVHALVTALLVFVGQSTACVEWTIANPPIIFGKTAELACVTVTTNASYNTQNVTTWIGGKDYSVLTYIGGTADRRKYAEVREWREHKIKSTLQIYKFDEKDVNADYSCSIGGHENRKRLSLAPDKFEYHPDKDTATVLASLRNGYLDVIVKILKVYPTPNCTIMFNKKIIYRRLTTKIGVNGILYNVEERIAHQVDVCRGQLIVTCVVGKTEIPVHLESFDGCTNHPDKDTATVLASLRNGYLDVIVKILKVYPTPNCTIMFNGKIISRRLTTKIGVNGISYNVEERIAHQVDVCRGQLIVTCVVGKTEIPVHLESFNGCTKSKETEYNYSLIISVSVGVLLFVILLIGIGCLAKYGKLKNVLSCNVSWRAEDKANVPELVRQYREENRNDTVLEEMIPVKKQGQ